jgi:hypothetical protein
VGTEQWCLLAILQQRLQSVLLILHAMQAVLIAPKPMHLFVMTKGALQSNLLILAEQFFLQSQ